jgi:hypothetical protein
MASVTVVNVTNRSSVDMATTQEHSRIQYPVDHGNICRMSVAETSKNVPYLYMQSQFCGSGQHQGFRVK